MTDPALSGVIPASASAGLLCPRCGYDLRGTSEPRCPECGLQFTWEELSRRADVPWLYETARGRLALRAWAGTLRRSLRPKRFWASIPLTLAPVPARLIRYWILTCAVVFLMTCAVKLVHLSGVLIQISALRRFLRRPVSDVVWETIGFYVMNPLEGLPRWPDWILPGAYVLATAISLAICAQSLARMRMKPGHLLRIVAYAGGAMIWWPVGIALAVMTSAVLRAITGPLGMNLFMVAQLLEILALTLRFGFLCVSILAFVYALRQGFRYYARYEKTMSIIAASQIIAALTALNIFAAALVR